MYPLPTLPRLRIVIFPELRAGMLWIAVGRLPLRELCGAGRKPDTCNMEPEPEHSELPGRSLPCRSECRGIELLHALHVRRERRKMRFPIGRRSRESSRNPPYLLFPCSCFLTGRPAYFELSKWREEGVRFPSRNREPVGLSSQQRLQNRKDQSYPELIEVR